MLIAPGSPIPDNNQDAVLEDLRFAGALRLNVLNCCKYGTTCPVGPDGLPMEKTC